jgi:hypothetical protein
MTYVDYSKTIKLGRKRLISVLKSWNVLYALRVAEKGEGECLERNTGRREIY